MAGELFLPFFDNFLRMPKRMNNMIKTLYDYQYITDKITNQEAHGLTARSLMTFQGDTG